MAKSINKRVTIYINGIEVENTISSIRAEMRKLINEQNKMTVGSEEYVRASKQIQGLKGILDQHREANKAVNKELEAGKNILDSTLMKWTAATVLINTVSNLYSKLQSKIQGLSDEFARYDDILSSTEKYTGMTRDQVLDLNEELQKIDTRTSIERLQGLAQEAGKLGITAKEHILDFVDAANVINVALGEDLGKDAVLNIGKLAMMFGDDKKYGLKQAMLNTASAINEVAQSSSASEPYLMNFMAKLSGTGKQAGLTQAQMIGLGSALDQNMQEIEVSTSTISQLLIKLYQEPAKFARVAQMDVQAFTKLMKEDANEGLLTFIDTLSKKGGLADLAPIFKEVGLNGIRASQIISVLAGNIDNIRQQQENATKAYTEGQSVFEEYNRMNENQAAALEKARNAAALKRAELGEKMIPVLTLLTKAEGSFLNLLGKLPKFLNDNKAWLLVVVGALIKYEMALLRVGGRMAINYALHLKEIAVQKAKAIATDFATLRLYFQGLAYDVATKKVKFHIAAQEALRMVMMKIPWGLVLGAVSALGVGIYKLVSANNKAKKSFDDINKSVADKTTGTIAQLERLSRIWELTGSSMEEKEKFIKKNKEEFDKLGVSIQNVADAENLLITNKDQFISMLQEKAYAAAYKEKAEEIIKSNTKYTQPWIDQVMALQHQIEGLYDEMNKFPHTPEGVEAQMPILAQIKNLEGIRDSYKRQIDNYNQEALKLMEYSDEMLTKAQKRQETFNSLLKSTEVDGGGGSGSGYEPQVDPDEWKKFFDKVENLRKSFRKRELEGYAKEKEDVIQRYDELIEEAKQFGTKGVAIAKELEIEKGKSIIAAGQKYLGKYNDIIKKINEETAKISSKTDFTPGQSAFVSELLGTDKEWTDHINSIGVHISALTDLLKEVSDEEAVAIQQKIDELTDSYVNAVQGKTAATLNVIKKYAEDSEEFILDSEEYISNATLKEHDRRINEIKKKYDTQIEIITETLNALKKLNEEEPSPENEAEIARLESIIQRLEELKGEEVNVALKLSMDAPSIWEQILSPEFWNNFKDNFKDSMQTLTSVVDEVSHSMLSIYSDILNYQNQVSEYELNQYRDTQNKKMDALRKQLDSGVISQEAYNRKVEEINEASANRERVFKRKQFEKDRDAKLIQVLIEGGLAVAKAFAQYGWPWGLIPAALSTAQTAAQSAMIATQPNPYKMGGWIDKLMYIVAGEDGKEFMINNRTITDPKTAWIAPELDKFQKGQKSIFDGYDVDARSVSQTFARSGGTFTSTKTEPQIFRDYSSTNIETFDEMLKEMKQLNKYMRDPRNRQAIISRDYQLRFEDEEAFLRNLARL